MMKILFDHPEPFPSTPFASTSSNAARVERTLARGTRL
jgi:hypothetical protein